MDDILEYAKKELEYLTLEGDEREAATETILTLLQVLQNSRVHKYHGPGPVIGSFCRLANCLPLGPLTGAQDEWEETEGGRYVNKRCNQVVLIPGKGALHLKSRKFSRDGGKTWIPSELEDVPVEFPYRVPGKPRRIYLGENETPEKWVAKMVEKGRIIG